ncbi:MAG: protein kinase, partial [Planctomycetaceae bacterium]|nr:protein kinase [Planctomycetaceae bacterium]
KTVKIGEVGLSKFITASRRSAQTQSVGTVYYMAPEVAKGRYGKEVDIYAMGILLYEMLTGQVPFDGESTGEILMKHLTEAPDLMKLPPRMRGVVSKALAKEPEKRYASIDQLLKAFNDALLGRSEPIDVPDQRAEPVPSPELYQTLPGTPASPRGHDQGFQASLNLQFVTDAGWWVLIGLVILSGLLLNRFLGLGRLSWLTLVTIAALGGLTYLLSSLFKSWRGAMTRSCGYGVPQRTAPIQQASIQTTTSFWEKGVAAVPITGLLTALLAAVKPTVFLNAEGQFPDWGMIGLFSTVAVSGVWGLLLLPAIWTRNSGKLPPGRFAAAMIGIGIGLLAFGVDQYLLLDISTNGDFRGDALYERIADQPLMVRGAGPTALGYILFFGSLFFIRDWALLLRSNRERRFSVASVLWTIAVAWFVTKIFAFPLPLALAWAAVLSCVVQLVSPWAPARQGRVTRLNA